MNMWNHIDAWLEKYIVRYSEYIYFFIGTVIPYTVVWLGMSMYFNLEYDAIPHGTLRTI